ncbi:MAG TPA: nicotinate phosphoribosyltransferase [Acidimicrobiales bacterium]
MTAASPRMGGILSTDEYQLTMAQLYFRFGLHERRVRFEHFFRSYPDYGEHQAGYCIAAGLEQFAEWALSTRATRGDVDALRTHRRRSGEPLFHDDFLDWFAGVGFDALRVEAVPEGRVVHANTPITVVEGPLAVAQLVETPLLNRLNFPTLIATKASRVVEAGQRRPVLEFGMRRAASGEGADVAARAAIVGGAASTSNAAVGYRLGITPAGTHAHSMVQLFMALGGGELAAFEAYADAYPDDCLLLVDTVDTLGSGVPNAIRVFEKLRRNGHKPVGIRLDSGDLAYLAVEASKMLDAAGFPDATIVLSSQLDELTVWQIVAQITLEARRAGLDPDHIVGRLVFGVGSRLVASDGDPILDGVYKLVAVEDKGEWLPAMKISDTPAKVLNPGAKRLWRVYDSRGRATADVLSEADEQLVPGTDLSLHHHAQVDISRTLPSNAWTRAEELLVPVIDGGRLVYPGGREGLADIEAARQRRHDDVDALHPGVRRLVNPHVYHVSITDKLFATKMRLIEQIGASSVPG